MQRSFAPDPSAARITISTGALVGGVDAHGALVWRGIPYAAPPVGDLRWRAPRPPVPWDGVREAVDFASVCPQWGSRLGGAPRAVWGKLWGDENCLFLNVHAPPADGRSDSAGLPVLVWIHGGGNTAGHGGFYAGGLLARSQRLIVVTINYRLGPLGWFRHPALAGQDARDASGNYALLDIIQALRWVQGEIAAFGGDPARITVAGESAGGGNVIALLVSPLARGLFHGAIVQSASTHTATPAQATNYRDAARPGDAHSAREIVLRLLGGPREAARARARALPPPTVAARLRALSVRELFALYGTADGELGTAGPARIRDGHVLPATPPLRLFARGQWQQVPVMLGSNRDEARLFMAFDDAEVVRVAGLPLWPRHPGRYETRAYYRSLAWKLRGVDRPAAAMLEGAPEASVYTYRWDWDEEGRFGPVNLSRLLGAAHGLEIPFVFGDFDIGPESDLLYHDRNASGREALSRWMGGYWGEFVRTGAPGDGGHGAALWLARAAAPGPAHLMILDTPAEGGPHMGDARVTRPGLLAQLAADARLDRTSRCALRHALLAFLDPAHQDASRPHDCGDEAGAAGGAPGRRDRAAAPSGSAGGGAVTGAAGPRAVGVEIPREEGGVGAG